MGGIYFKICLPEKRVLLYINLSGSFLEYFMTSSAMTGTVFSGG
jgi:hypothetical protein